MKVSGRDAAERWINTELLKRAKFTSRHDFYRILDKFWSQFDKLTGVPQKRDLLLRLACVKVSNPVHRVTRRIAFQRNKRIKFKRQCQVCSGPSVARHHIILLKNGGHNVASNLLIVCKECHEFVHPWLRS